MMSYSPSVFSAKIQTSPAYYIVSKAANTIVYFSLVLLTWRFFTHRFDWQLATGCVVISGCWLILTGMKTGHLLQTYFDILSRIELQLPVIIGITMSVVALFPHGRPWYHYIALAEIVGWIFIYALYRRNKTRFEKEGHGPVPVHTWINPPVSVLKAGDLILTSGNIASTLHESVGHAETVLRMPDGQMTLFSSYMDKGACLQPIATLRASDNKRLYIALHLKDPWTDAQCDQAARIARKMVEINRTWAERENLRLAKVITLLPLAATVRTRLEKELHQSGYDWFGTFMGRVTQEHWTCIGACVALYKQMGVSMNHYGTGLLGFGTTLFDPIMPMRFLSDPAFELIKTSENMQAEPTKALEYKAPIQPE